MPSRPRREWAVNSEARARYMKQRRDYWQRKKYAIYSVPVVQSITDEEELKSIAVYNRAYTASGFYFDGFLYHSSALSKVLNMTKDNISKHQKSGFIPVPVFRAKVKTRVGFRVYRVYTIEEVKIIISWVQKIRNRRGRLSHTAPEYMPMVEELEIVRNKYRLGETGYAK